MPDWKCSRKFMVLPMMACRSISWISAVGGRGPDGGGHRRPVGPRPVSGKTGVTARREYESVA
jgi:hypothetical protein